jgi:hypothetical protein
MVPPATNTRLIHAAAKAGVAYVMPNCFGVDLTNQALSEGIFYGALVRADVAEIEKLGVSCWIAVVSGLWYEYSLAMGPEWFGFDFTAKRLTYYDDGNTKINVTTWEQTARALAALLGLKELPFDEDDTSPTVSTWRNKPLYISSFLLSQRDMFASWKRVSGDKDEDWTIDHEPVQERYKRGVAEMQNGSVQGRAVAMFSRVFFPNGDGNHEDKHGLANSLLGLPREDLDERTKVAKDMIANNFSEFVRRKTYLGDS